MNNKLIALLAIGFSIAAVGFYASQMSEQPQTLRDIARVVNSDPTSTWQATETPNLSFNFEQSKSMFNLQIGEVPLEFDEQPPLLTEDSDLPENFDPRDKWNNCESLREVRDQSACGSCWAFGAASAMTDRLCIASQQKDQRRISTLDILSCCGFKCGMGCNGGYLYPTWLFWKMSGVSTGGLWSDKRWCKPYEFPPCNHHSDGPYDDCSKHHYQTPSCKRTCTNSDYKKDYNKDKIFGDKVYKVNGKEDNIKKELFEKIL